MKSIHGPETTVGGRRSVREDSVGEGSQEGGGMEEKSRPGPRGGQGKPSPGLEGTVGVRL